MLVARELHRRRGKELRNHQRVPPDAKLANHGRKWHACEEQGRCGGRYCDRTRIEAETPKILDRTSDDGSGYEEEQWSHPKMIEREVPDEDKDQCFG